MTALIEQNSVRSTKQLLRLAARGSSVRQGVTQRPALCCLSSPQDPFLQAPVVRPAKRRRLTTGHQDGQLCAENGGRPHQLERCARAGQGTTARGEHAPRDVEALEAAVLVRRPKYCSNRRAFASCDARVPVQLHSGTSCGQLCADRAIADLQGANNISRRREPQNEQHVLTRNTPKRDRLSSQLSSIDALQDGQARARYQSGRCDVKVLSQSLDVLRSDQGWLPHALKVAAGARGCSHWPGCRCMHLGGEASNASQLQFLQVYYLKKLPRHRFAGWCCALLITEQARNAPDEASFTAGKLPSGLRGGRRHLDRRTKCRGETRTTGNCEAAKPHSARTDLNSPSDRTLVVRTGLCLAVS